MSDDLKAQRTNAIDHAVVPHLVAGYHTKAGSCALIGEPFLSVSAEMDLITAVFNNSISRLVKSGLVQKHSSERFTAAFAGVRWDDQRKRNEADAQEWIQDALAGGPLAARGIFKHALDGAGIKQDVLRIAAKLLGIHPARKNPG